MYTKRMQAKLMFIGLCIIALFITGSGIVEAADLFMGKSDGLGDFRHDGDPLSYTWRGGWGDDLNVVDIVMDPNNGGLHVIHDGGMTYYDYDPMAHTFIVGGSFDWDVATVRAIAVAADGTIFAGGSSGFGAFVYDKTTSSYGETAVHWFANDTYNIAIDLNGHIHIQQVDGLSGWTYDASTGFTLTAWDGGWRADGDSLDPNSIVCGTIVIDPDNATNSKLHIGKWDGIGDVVYDSTQTNPGGGQPFGYTWDGHWAESSVGVNAGDIDEASDEFWIGQNDGIQVRSLPDYNLLAWGRWNEGIDAICFDSAGKVHAGKPDGMMAVVTQPGVETHDDIVWDGTSWFGTFPGADVKVIVEIEAFLKNGHGFGDANEDGIINLVDFAVIASEWLVMGTASYQPDINGDGDVDFADLLIVIDHWLNVD